MKSEVYERNAKARDEMLARSLDAAAGIKKREDQLRRPTCDLCTNELQNALRLMVGFSKTYCEL
jgi:hypothetical protein